MVFQMNVRPEPALRWAANRRSTKQDSRDMGPGSEPCLHTQRSDLYDCPAASAQAHSLPSDRRGCVSRPGAQFVPVCHKQPPVFARTLAPESSDCVQSTFRNCPEGASSQKSWPQAGTHPMAHRGSGQACSWPVWVRACFAGDVSYSDGPSILW